MNVAAFDVETGRPTHVFHNDSPIAMSYSLALGVPLGSPSRVLDDTVFAYASSPFALPNLAEFDQLVAAGGGDVRSFSPALMNPLSWAILPI